MKIGEICNRSVITVSTDASILEVAQEMRTHHIGDVVVSESADGVEKPIGIITDRDIVIELVAEEVTLDTVNVGDVMSTTLVTAPHDADLFETLRFMGIKGVRRIPVLDDDGGLYGILSVNEILGVLTKELSFISEVSERQIARERSSRE
ncbi:MAG: CBS domain-containing protein [Gammaproteobacteria bacterium]|nr:CBS domain-containing protein [Gammaproteobacteria bacterium]